MTTPLPDLFENGLCFYCDLAIRELREYGDFHSRTEKLWKGEDLSLQEDIDNILHAHPEIDEQDVIDSYSWDLHLNQTKYPDIHRRALVISLYVFLEDQLNGLCSVLGKSIQSPIALDDIAGQGIERACRYMSKVALFDLGVVSRLSFVREVNRLRNRLVHAGGILPIESNDKLNKFVAQSNYLVGNPGWSVGILPEFIDHCIDELCSFFEELDSQVTAFIKRLSELDEREKANGGD
jgi:hypothetical protein